MQCVKVTLKSQEFQYTVREILYDGHLYKLEPKWVVVTKCAALFIAVLPIYFALYTLYHCVKLPLVTLANRTLSIRPITDILRIPYYWIMMEAAAFCGIFKPREAMIMLSRIEAKLHDDKGKKMDVLRYEGYRTHFVKSLFQENYPYTLFIAFCMQPIGTVDHPDIIRIVPKSQFA